MIELVFCLTRRALVALICLAVISPPASAGAVKLGILKFGTVSWEADVIKQHGLDKAEEIDLQTVELANNDAAAIALQAGSVDIIVTDWVWVSRERADGSPLTFVPYSTSIGSLMLPGDSAITNLLGLEGRKLGIAGGPTDKSWLILRALTEQRHGFDLADKVEKVFAAPPLLNEELVSHHLDAVLIYWNYAAQLEAQGFKKLISVEDAAKELGLTTNVPMLGYVFDESWANAHQSDVLAFVHASRKAKEILATSDTEWQRLRPLMKAVDDATFAALREGYRRGVPQHWGEGERADAARLFAIMVRLGGKDLVGRSNVLQPGTFWPAVTY
jgi:NitT/TauT family transport system substrate-binding protein